MSGLLLIAHAPLASALKAVAEHTFPDCKRQLAVLDVTPEMSAEAVEAEARALLAQSGHVDALVLTDVYGATPCNGARRLLDAGGHVQVVTGVNVPMLWRSLCYASEPLAVLAERASEGGAKGIVLTQAEDSKDPIPSTPSCRP